MDFFLLELLRLLVLNLNREYIPNWGFIIPLDIKYPIGDILFELSNPKTCGFWESSSVILGTNSVILRTNALLLRKTWKYWKQYSSIAIKLNEI